MWTNNKDSNNYKMPMQTIFLIVLEIIITIAIVILMYVNIKEKRIADSVQVPNIKEYEYIFDEANLIDNTIENAINTKIKEKGAPIIVIVASNDREIGIDKFSSIIHNKINGNGITFIVISNNNEAMIVISEHLREYFESGIEGEIINNDNIIYTDNIEEIVDSIIDNLDMDEISNNINLHTKESIMVSSIITSIIILVLILTNSTLSKTFIGDKKEYNFEDNSNLN